LAFTPPGGLVQVETKLKSRFPSLEKRERLLRAVWRTGYVFISTLVAASLPFFGDLMGLIGATGFTPMTFVLPAVLWLVARRGQLVLWEKVVNWGIVVVFTIVGVLAFIGSVSSIADNASTYKSWS
jgi:amino acid permease